MLRDKHGKTIRKNDWIKVSDSLNHRFGRVLKCRKYSDGEPYIVVEVYTKLLGTRKISYSKYTSDMIEKIVDENHVMLLMLEHS